ncbi:MAG: HIT family protein [Crocinitomicaceae bacterium]|nr:HIT family protein [Crocinitomicaceae bacterium]|tara:strand:+ start:238 stop:633 length:396 start_codon:yes stop_codon:yes gene_type:complete
MASIFSKIISGEIPCHKVAENESCFAFLDIAPLALGHTLVVPKREVDKYFDLSDEEIAQINIFAKTISSAIESVVPCTRIGVAVIGLEVPHAHIHLIPLNSIGDINFERQKLELSQDLLADTARQIREALG